MTLRRTVTRGIGKLPHFLRDPIVRGYYQRVVRSEPSFIRSDLAVIRRLVRPGDHVVDVGANIGVYTRVLAECVGPDGLVTAIEAVPATCRILAHNVTSLGLQNVQVIQCAASNRVGSVRMAMPENSHYLARVSADGDEVPCDTLDHLVAGTPTFIKLDVEGHEVECLQGAERLLAYQPVWLIELTKGGVFSVMEQWGYRAYWSERGTLRSRRSDDESADFFFLTDQRAQDVGVVE